MKITQSLSQIRLLLDSIRAELRDAVESNLTEIRDAKTVSVNPSVFLVKMSTIAKMPDLCLAPSMYSLSEQKRAVLRLIDETDPEYAIECLRELVHTGKSKSSYLADIRFHPDTLKSINIIMEEIQ